MSDLIDKAKHAVGLDSKSHTPHNEQTPTHQPAQALPNGINTDSSTVSSRADTQAAGSQARGGDDGGSVSGSQQTNTFENSGDARSQQDQFSANAAGATKQSANPGSSF